VPPAVWNASACSAVMSFLCQQASPLPLPPQQLQSAQTSTAKEACSVEVGYHARSPGDLFLICSKRVTVTLDIDAMTRLITNTLSRHPSVLVRSIVDEACRLWKPNGPGVPRPGDFGSPP